VAPVKDFTYRLLSASYEIIFRERMSPDVQKFLVGTFFAAVGTLFGAALTFVFNILTHIVERSLAEMDLFPITFKKMSNMIVQSGFRIAAVRDTHFRLHFLAKMPIVREIAIPLVAFIAEK